MISSFFFFFFRFFRPFPLPSPPFVTFIFIYFYFLGPLEIWMAAQISTLPRPDRLVGSHDVIVRSACNQHTTGCIFSLFFFCLDCLHTTVIYIKYIYIYSKVYILFMLFIHFYRFFPRFSSFSSNDYYLPSSRFVFSFFLLLLLLSSHILIFS